MSQKLSQLTHSVQARRREWSLLDQLEVETTDQSTRSVVQQCLFPTADGPVPCYVKIYNYTESSWFRIWRSGRCPIETRNLLLFEALGIPTLKVLAWGQRSNAFGKLEQEFIITQTAEQMIPLDELLIKRRLARKTRLQIIDQIAANTRTLHQHHFYHKDLHWRNLLINKEGNTPTVCWIDCPRGSFHHSPWQRRHWQQKDCATLDKHAYPFCTIAERRRFAAQYLQQAETAPEVAEFGMRIDALRRKRLDNRAGRTKISPPPYER